MRMMLTLSCQADCRNTEINGVGKHSRDGVLRRLLVVFDLELRRRIRVPVTCGLWSRANDRIEKA